jgi:Tfp pilus assembly protein PilN
VTLRTNLATRPFYNVRAVQAVLGAIALVVIAFTLFNVIQLVRLAAAQRQLGAHASEAEGEAAKLRADAARIRTQIDQKELEAVAAAAREANAIIDRRAFSWTDLFAQLEATLPADVRITRVQRRLDQGVFKVGVTTEARRTEDMADFIEALEKTGQFRNVVPLEQRVEDDGLIAVAIEGEYLPPSQPARPSAAPSTPSGTNGATR